MPPHRPIFPSCLCVSRQTENNLILEQYKNLQVRNMITPRAVRRGKVHGKKKSFIKSTHKEKESARDQDRRRHSVKSELRRQAAGE